MVGQFALSASFHYAYLAIIVIGLFSIRLHGTNGGLFPSGNTEEDRREGNVCFR